MSAPSPGAMAAIAYFGHVALTRRRHVVNGAFYWIMQADADAIDRAGVDEVYEVEAVREENGQAGTIKARNVRQEPRRYRVHKHLFESVDGLAWCLQIDGMCRRAPSWARAHETAFTMASEDARMHTPRRRR